MGFSLNLFGIDGGGIIGVIGLVINTGFFGFYQNIFQGDSLKKVISPC
jgi:hypothetical protein